jgi:hypothetical protein
VATNVSKRLAYLTKRMSDFDRVVTTIAAQTIADAVLEQSVRATGGSFSGMGGGRYRFDVKLTPLSSPVGVRIRPPKNQAGMWTILERGRAAGYAIRAKPKRGKTSRGRAMRGANTDTGWAAGPFTGGAWRGKGSWSKGVDAGVEDALAKVRAEFREVARG